MINYSASIKISQLDQLTGSNITLDDYFPIVDGGSNTTKRVTINEFKTTLFKTASIGADTNVIFQSGSALSGSNNLRFDYVNNILHVTNSISASRLYGTSSWATTASYALNTNSTVSNALSLIGLNNYPYYTPSTTDAGIFFISDTANSKAYGEIYLGISGSSLINSNDYSSSVGLWINGKYNDGSLAGKRLPIYLGGDGNANSITPSITIKNDGQVGINTIKPTGSSQLSIKGNIDSKALIVGWESAPYNYNKSTFTPYSDFNDSNLGGIFINGGGLIINSSGSNSNDWAYFYTSGSTDLSDLYITTADNGDESIIFSGRQDYPIPSLYTRLKLAPNPVSKSAVLATFYGEILATSDLTNNYGGIIKATNYVSSSNIYCGNNMGIRTDNAQYPLDVNGSIRATGNIGNNPSLGNFIGNSAGANASYSTNSNFIGEYAGYGAYSSSNSTFIGTNAGYGAYTSSNSTFIGTNAGSGSYSSSYSTFIGYNAGKGVYVSPSSSFIGVNAGNGAINSKFSSFIGNNAGYGAAGSYSSSFIGVNAGYSASNSQNSNFIGADSGYKASGSINANFIGNNAGYNSTNSDYSNLIGYQAGQNASSSGYVNFIGEDAGNTAISSNNSNFIGYNAGYKVHTGNSANFIGARAGQSVKNGQGSNFIGYYAGYETSGSSYSNFIGYNAGNNSDYSENSNFIGSEAGMNADRSNNSNFIGVDAGQRASSSNSSNFIGYQAGFDAPSSPGSIFIGTGAGRNASNSDYSTFIGFQAGKEANNSTKCIFIGYQAGSGSNSYSNAISIGNDSNPIANNSLNIANIIHANNTNTADRSVSVSGSFTSRYFILPTGSSNPVFRTTGSAYFDYSTNKLYIYNGTTWKSASLV